jgi:2-oxoisovalerate dehydrogenase E2 component (dihydrolipoyl transacylase)
LALRTVTMPQLGESVTEGTVDRWLKKEGELVRRDEPLVEVVTDKVNAEVPSPFEGRLTRISVTAGSTVPIGTALAELDVEGAEAEPVPPAAGGTAAGGKAADPAPEPAHDAPQELAPRAHEPHAAEVAPVEREELFRVSAVRRQIAEHMVRSKHTAPHAWGMREVDMSALVAYREANKEDFARRHGISLTYLPFVIQVVCDALKANPFLNSSWTDEGILLKRYVNIGVAVALPDALVVPVIKDADRLGLLDVARAVNDLSTRARTKSLRPEDVRGGTFTVNNTGAIGSIQGMAIINQPQAAILSTEKIVKRPVVVDDAVVIRPIMYLTISFDHRVVDGLQTGRFMDHVQAGLEGWTPAHIRH